MLADFAAFPIGEFPLGPSLRELSIHRIADCDAGAESELRQLYFLS